ncbi:hypothetical protein DWZ16_02800 [Clostridium sp. AF29-8BH]|nr:hypothetical protein DWZ16_02800 [Clostridium sp. AF29-8BH]
MKLFHSLDLKLKSCLIALFGSAFLAFGLYHVHSFSGVTEGGVLGMTLLLDHWFHISPSVSGFIMNLACYAMGWKLLGRQFIAYSILSSASFSLSYRICEQFPPLWPQLADMPLAASLLGAVFVGIGAGLCVRIGGAPGGDDALAMSLSHVTHIKIQWIYLLSDFAVLVLSLSYIPLNRMVYSILTVLLSGQIIGFVQTAGTHPVENMELDRFHTVLPVSNVPTREQ